MWKLFLAATQYSWFATTDLWSLTHWARKLYNLCSLGVKLADFGPIILTPEALWSLTHFSFHSYGGKKVSLSMEPHSFLCHFIGWNLIALLPHGKYDHTNCFPLVLFSQTTPPLHPCVWAGFHSAGCIATVMEEEQGVLTRCPHYNRGCSFVVSNEL